MTYSLSETDKTKLATEAAESFVDLYYTAINAARHTLKDFYLPSSPSGGQLLRIIYNGELLQDAKVLQERFENEMPWCHYEAQSVNAHVMNPCIDPNGSKTKKEAERNLSLLVQISGYVRLVERKDGPIRAISDNFVLVPNKEGVGAKGTGIQDQGKRWVIQSQNFRYVV
ncbi:hypothetical protein MRB53_039484 [Persea americana]|nr:hypothetical protein MRB53_039484 [Persea americana]